MRAAFEGNVYLVAAGRIAEHKETFACCALGLPEDPERERFVELFKPFPSDSSDPRPHQNGWYGPHNSHEARSARVLALCFMAAMVEAGDA